MAVAIVGCGFIGHKRARSLKDRELAICCDAVMAQAENLAASFPFARATCDWGEVLRSDKVQIVILAVTHDCLAPLAMDAVRAGKHVLIEKPGARRAHELDPVRAAAREAGALVRVGFNHRYHRSFQKAQELFREGAIGDLMFVRGRYGHGGRVGYEKEWRADPEKSGGGELIDQGVHLIDLARWFLGDFSRVQSQLSSSFWSMPVEDNAFLLLSTPNNQTAFLHASWTEWKNLFSFEIYGRTGKLSIDGLGGSYGTERLTYYRMTPDMGPPLTTSWEFPMADNSWDLEFADFEEDIRLGREPHPGIEDAQAALRVIEAAYENANL